MAASQSAYTIRQSEVKQIDRWRVMTHVEKAGDERVKRWGVCILSDFDLCLR